MKRILYACIVILICSTCYGQVVKVQEVAVGSIVKHQEVAIGSVVEIEEVSLTLYDCTNGLMFGWGFENTTVTSGTPAGCSDGDTTASAVASISLDTAAGIGGPYNGTYSLLINALDEGYSFTPSSNDIVDLDDIKITFKLYVDSAPQKTGGAGYQEFFLVYYDDGSAIWNNYISALIEESGPVLKIYRAGQDTNHSVSITISEDTWLSCEYQMKAGLGSGYDTYLNCNGTSDEQEHGNLTSEGDAEYMLFGDQLGSADIAPGVFYLDDVRITLSDRY